MILTEYFHLKWRFEWQVSLVWFVVAAILPLSAGSTIAAAAINSEFVSSTINESLFTSAAGDIVSIRLNQKTTVNLTTVKVAEGTMGALTWIGFDADRGVTARSYISNFDGAVTGLIEADGSIYELRPSTTTRGSTVVIDLAATGVSRFITAKSDALQTPRALVSAAEASAMQAARWRSLEVQKLKPSPQTQIDFAVVYTPGMRALYGSTAGVVSRINTLVQYTNDAYSNSEVAITLRLVGTQEVVYPETGNNSVALEDMTGKDNVATGCPLSGCPDRNPLSSLAVDARSLREATGADIVALLRPLSSATNGGCGVSWVYAPFGNIPFSAQFGYSTVSDGSDNGRFCPVSTLAHELGHAMGLVHDRPNAGGSAGATEFSFGYGLNYVSSTTAALGDIMSYSQANAPFYSSPNVRCNTNTQTCQIGGSGAPLGVAGDTDTGACTTNPGTCADGARTLNITRADIAAFRATVVSQTIISGTISNGAALAGVTFCARPSAGVSCVASDASGAYSCAVPNGWSGTLHSPSVSGNRIPPQTFSAVTSATTRNITALSGVPSCNLDVDNNGLIEPLTDGVAIVRRMMGFTASALDGLAGACAANTTGAAIFNATSSNYNVTGGAATLAATDGSVIVRAMSRRTGTDVTNGLGLSGELGATNTTWPSIQSWLNNTCGSSF